MSFLDSTTTCSLGGSTTSFVGDGVYVDKESLLTTLSASLSSALTTNGPSINIRLDATRDYISSKSGQELDSILLMIDERENEILRAVDEVPKAKKLGTMDKKSNN